jgi:uncharacterized protein
LNKKICIGTAQFGLNYGINNKQGKPSENEIFKIMDTATENGMYCYDTASVYGDAENILGKYIKNNKLDNKIKIISKFSADVKITKKKDIYKRIENEIVKSLDRLNIDKLEGYLLHKFSDYKCESIKETLFSLKENKIVNNIGVSIYHPEEAIKIAEEGLVDLIQIPYNVFDRRLDKKDFFKLTGKKNIKVFARSVYLQGLLLMDVEEIPENLYEVKEAILEFNRICSIYKISAKELALLYCYLNNDISSIVIGIERNEQLIENINILKKVSDFKDYVKKIRNMEFNLSDKILNPYLWKI